MTPLCLLAIYGKFIKYIRQSNSFDFVIDTCCTLPLFSFTLIFPSEKVFFLKLTLSFRLNGLSIADSILFCTYTQTLCSGSVLCSFFLSSIALLMVPLVPILLPPFKKNYFGYSFTKWRWLFFIQFVDCDLRVFF